MTFCFPKIFGYEKIHLAILYTNAKAPIVLMINKNNINVNVWLSQVSVRGWK
jgi:hypothetical protein